MIALLCMSALGVTMALLPTPALAQARRRVAVPRQVVEHLQRDTTLSEVVAEHRDRLADYLVAEPLDLDRDGTPELVVRGTDAICGANNCVAWIYRRPSSGYEQLLSAGSVQTIEPRRAVAHGYRDVMTGMHDSAWQHDLTLYRFDGRAYRRARCFTRTDHEVDARGEPRELRPPRIVPVACRPDDAHDVAAHLTRRP